MFRKIFPSKKSSSSLNTSNNNNNLEQNSSQSTSNSCSTTSNDETYSIAEEIVKDKIAGDNVEDLKVLQKLRQDEVIVVSGSADKIETVFAKIHLPFTLISPEQLIDYQLKPEYTLYMNCHPSGYLPKALENVKRFVATGGLLITTDYVLNMLLTQIFPEVLHYGGESTGDKSVAIECSDDPYDEILKAFKGEKEWKLAGGSHPITIKDHQNVTVLINSKQLATEFGGKGAVLIRFQYLQGTVYHMISHFHLQHGGVSGATAQNAVDYAKQKGATQQTVEKMERMENKNLVFLFYFLFLFLYFIFLFLKEKMGKAKSESIKRAEIVSQTGK